MLKVTFLCHQCWIQIN